MPLFVAAAAAVLRVSPDETVERKEKSSDVEQDGWPSEETRERREKSRSAEQDSWHPQRITAGRRRVPEVWVRR
eukprot:3844351-Lingulodinium_polyedra.AAC.1